MRVEFQGFTITHDGDSLVRVVKLGVADKDFDVALHQAHRILHQFIRSKPGSIWGCDGVGYRIQRDKGEVIVNKSGVGPIKFRQGVVALRSLEAKCQA